MSALILVSARLLHLRRPLPRARPPSASSPTRPAASAARWPCSRRSPPPRRSCSSELEPAFADRVARPAARRGPGPRPPAHRAPTQRADPAQARPGRQPARLDRRPGRLRARSSALVAGLVVGFAAARAARRRPPGHDRWSCVVGRAGRLHRRRTCTSTRRPTTARETMQRDAARRHRPADHLGRVRPRLRRRARRRSPATPTGRWPRSSPGCCRRCRSAWAAPRRCARWASAPTSPTCEAFVGAMVQADALRHPDRPGAARAVARDAGQAPPAGRGEGAAGAGEDH